jgi:hypothetical protein
MMKLDANSFYVKKNLTTTIPLINEFSDLPLSGSASTNNTFFKGYNTLSTGDVTSFHILSGNTSSGLNYGDYQLDGAYYKVFTEEADTNEGFAPLNVKLWSVDSDYGLEQGGFTLAQSGTTGAAMGHSIAAYHTRPFSSLPNMIETFDDRTSTHSTKMGNMFYSGPYVPYNDFLNSMNNKAFWMNKLSFKKNNHLKDQAIANVTVDRDGQLIVPLKKVAPEGKLAYYLIAKTGKDINGHSVVLGLAGSYNNEMDKIYPDAATGLTDLQGSIYGAMKLTINKNPRDKLNVQYSREMFGALQGSEAGIAPMMGGLMSAYELSKTIQTPYTADLSNAFIYSNVQVSDDVGEGGNGNALRIYHEWDYAASNRDIETSQMGGDTAITPQVFMLGCYNLPVPLVTDAADLRKGDKRTFLPRIDINMNIKTLGPTPLYGETTHKAQFCSGSTNFTMYTDGTNKAAVADFFLSGNGSTPGTSNTTYPANKDRSESLLRSVAVVFSNYKPLDSHKTLDEFLDYGLSNFYGQVGTNTGQTHQGVVGGVLFRCFGMQNGSDTGTKTSEPPGFDSGKVYAQPLPVTYNPDIAKVTNIASATDGQNSMLTYASGGLVGFQPSATVGSSVNDRMATTEGSMNVVATAGTRNIRNVDKTSLLGPVPNYVMNSIELPMGSYFNMSFFIDVLASGSSYTNAISPYHYWPYTGTSAWPNGGTSGGAAMNAGGTNMRVVFSTKGENKPISSTSAPATTDSNENLLYLDIPFPNTKDTRYAFTDTDNNALSYLLYPRYMTIWVQNYRWIRGSQNGSRAGSDDLFYFGDYVQDGASMQAEVLIDSISLSDFYPEYGVSNFTATNPSQDGWNITDNTVMSPLTTLQSGNYTGSSFQDGKNAQVGSPLPMDFNQVSPGTYLSLGFDDKSKLPLLDSNEAGGYLFFNDYYTDNRDTQQRIVPADLIGQGANLSVLNTLSGATYENLQETGHMFVGSVLLDSTSGYNDPIANGPARFTVDNNTATDNALSLASGTNNTNLSVDGFTQKGFASLNVKGSSTTGAGTYGTWGKRENPLVSTKVTGFVSIDNRLNAMQIRVADPTIFNPLSSDEEYIIYRPYRNGAIASATYARSGLKLAAKNAINGDVVTFTENVKEANSGGVLLSEATLAELYISPYKYWMTVMFKGDREHVPRGYGQVCMVNETPAVSNIANLTGTTWNESNYTYLPLLTGANDAGDSSPYYSRWDLNNISGTSVIITDEDYGHGELDPETNVGGWVAKQLAVSGTYSTFNLTDFVNNKTIGEDESFFLLQQLEGVEGDKTVKQVGMDNTTKTNYTEYVPRYYYKFKDKLPSTPTLTVKPAVDLLSETTDLYNITTENMNAIKFEWDETDDDIWYRYIICSTGSINNKYAHARLWIPLNEESPNQDQAIQTVAHTVYNVVSGTTAAITNNGAVPSDIDGLSGYSPIFKNVTNAFLTLPTTTGFDFPFTTDGSNSATEFSVVAHAILDTGSTNQKYFILSKGAASGLQILVSGANTNTPCVQVNQGGSFLTSSPIDIENGEPMCIIYTYKKDSEFGPDAKLYVNGTLEDYGATATTLPTTDAAMYIGGRGASDKWKGRIEEIIFYDVEIKVPDSANNYLYSTANEADKSGSSGSWGDIINHNAKLFLFDYHNIRGRTFREVTSSNQVSWRATPL